MELVEVNNDDEDGSYLMLTAKSDSGSINVSSKTSLTDMGVKLSGVTCKCESTSYNFGFEVMSICECSNWTRGNCKKTHTLTKLARASFQLIE